MRNKKVAFSEEKSGTENIHAVEDSARVEKNQKLTIDRRRGKHVSIPEIDIPKEPARRERGLASGNRVFQVQGSARDAERTG